MPHYTGDETADFLLRQLKLVQRVGSDRMKRDAAKWEIVIRTNAAAAEEPMAVSFATARSDQPNESGEPEGR